MEEFMDLQIGDEISFQKINPMKKGILLNKRYCIKDIFNIWDDWKCIAFIGENKRRVVLRNNLYRFSHNYKFLTHKQIIVKKKYQKAYDLYLKKLKDRPHKYGKTKCLVCDNEFDKTNGKHYYCSRECRRIQVIYNDIN